MVNAMTRFKVKDYAAWKSVFDENEDFRKSAGSASSKVFRSVDDPNDLVILMQWDSIENGKKFASSDDLKKKMQQAGVISKPEFYFPG